MNLYDRQPSLGKDVFVAPNAVVVGDVKLGNHASVFYGAVLRGASFRSGSSAMPLLFTRLPASHDHPIDPNCRRRR